MKLERPSLTRKSDIKHAFKLIPIHPSDHHKLGFKLADKFYYDTTLPQGASSACQIFETFSTAVQAIYEYFTAPDSSTHYLDDFFFIDQNISTAERNQLIFDQICSDIGIPQAPDKKTSPAHQTEFLGILLDYLNWIASLPKEKLETYSQSISALLDRDKVTQRELQSIIGKLSFATSVVPARPFLRRLRENLYRSPSIPLHTPHCAYETRLAYLA